MFFSAFFLVFKLILKNFWQSMEWIAKNKEYQIFFRKQVCTSVKCTNIGILSYGTNRYCKVVFTQITVGTFYIIIYQHCYNY